MLWKGGLGRRDFLKTGAAGTANLAASAAAAAGIAAPTDTFHRLAGHLHSVSALDCHDHLRPFEGLWGYVETDRGRGMNLYSLWNTSYYQNPSHLTVWKPGETFDSWWARAQHDFDNGRALSFYRYMLPAFQDLYGVDFDHITDTQARELDQRIFQNYRDKHWIDYVVTERSNIEVMIIDPYWARLDYPTAYRFQARNLNTASLLSGFHPSEFKDPRDDPYRYAQERGIAVRSLDDYLVLIDTLCREAKEKGAVCLTDDDTAYERTLQFDNVPAEKAVRAFGRKRSELTPQEIKDFQDFIMWRLVEMSARYDLPYQIHTGNARLQGSSPMLLIELIEANPKTKFALMHGGFPWIGETGGIAFEEIIRANNVWIDSCWLPTLSYSMAKRAFHEWLELVPSNRIVWGSDLHHAEGIYAATEMTRRCLAEVLAEKVARSDLTEAQAMRIGKQIMRDNALELFPRLKPQLWKSQLR